MPDPRELLDAYAAIRTIAPLESSDPPDEHGDYRTELGDIAPKTFAALRAVVDLADTLDSNAAFMDADGADPMVAHQKRHNAYCVRRTIATALEGDDG